MRTYPDSQIPARALRIAACFVVALLVLGWASIGANGSGAPPAGPPAAGQKWAVLVGIDTYQREDVTPLKFAVADVKSLAWALRTYCGVPSDNIFTLTSDQKGDNAPTRTNLAFRLDWLAQHVQPQDTVFFLFSGHGMEAGGATYLMTCEADARSEGTLKESGYDTRRLQESLSKLKARRLLAFVDACRNDPHAGRGVADNLMGKGMARDLAVVRTRLAPSSAAITATIFACSPGQRSYEWNDEHHGFFTYHVLQGLKGKAADSKGLVTVPSLLAYLESAVPQSSGRVMNARQVPWMSAEGSGLSSWVLAKAAPGAADAHPNEAADEPQAEAMNTSPGSYDMLVKAQQAFDAGHFAEPAGDNAFEYAHQVLARDPANATARELEKRAADAYEIQAKAALNSDNKARALEMYQRLSALFPDRDYSSQIRTLNKPPTPAVIGTWDCSYNGGFLVGVIAWTDVIREDGTCERFTGGHHGSLTPPALASTRLFEGELAQMAAPKQRSPLKGHVGNWVCTNSENRTYQFTWSTGVETWTLSADGMTSTCTGFRGQTYHGTKRSSADTAPQPPDNAPAPRAK